MGLRLRMRSDHGNTWVALQLNFTAQADLKVIAKIIKIEITGDESCDEGCTGLELHVAIGSDVKAVWVLASINYGNLAFVIVHLRVPGDVVRLE